MENITTVESLSSANTQTPPLRTSVEQAIKRYFAQLGEQKISEVYGLVLAEVEPPLFKAVLEYTRGNQSKAAVLLGLSRGTLRKKLKIYGLL